MKLLMVGASPYARVVRSLAAERGLHEQIEVVISNPHIRPPELVAANPLSKVPTLIADDGTAHADSFAICLYLDTLGETPPIVLREGPERWPTLQRFVLANGVMDCTVIRRVESLMAVEPDRVAWMERQLQTTWRALDRFEETLPSFENHVAVDTIGVACALSYLDFRFPENEWRENRPGLARWLEEFDKRPSMQMTEYFE